MMHEISDLPEMLVAGNRYKMEFIGVDKQESASPDDWILLWRMLKEGEE